MSDFIHQTYGRLRVTSVAMRGNLAHAEIIRRTLEPVQGVYLVRVRPLTGSITVCYHPHLIGSQRLLHLLVKARALTNIVAFPRPFVKTFKNRPQPRAVKDPRQIWQKIPQPTKQFLFKAGKLAALLLIERAFDKTARRALQSLL